MQITQRLGSMLLFNVLIISDKIRFDAFTWLMRVT